ncbi:MAG: hypothetical protein H6767_03350 [Candidatus Peribacteria bacterium]|nr:MAG: hypothetical protein H6767_03350 [Candidatus Peribacteria bacterium]
MQQLTGGMSPGNITPFVDVYSSGGIFDIHFDREAIKTLLAYPRPVFIEIVRGRQDSYIVPLRLFLTFLILNGIYSPSDISEEPNDIFAQLQ